MGDKIRIGNNIPERKAMNDTRPEMERLFDALMKEKTGQERLKMGFSMFDLARSQALASIKREHPNAGMKEIKKEIFLRFYGEEFSTEERQKILARL